MSIRTRLTLSYVGFFAIALIALDAGLYLFVWRALLLSIDDDLQRSAQVIQNNFDESNQTPVTYFTGNGWKIRLQQPSVREFQETNLYVQFFNRRDVLSNNFTPMSTNLSEPIGVDSAALQAALEDQASRCTSQNGDLRMRELVMPLKWRGQIVGALQIARPMRETDHALQLLLYALIAGGAVALVAAARGGAWLTRAAFRPIDEVTRTAQSIVSAEDLSRRVPVPPAQDELQRLTVTVNDLLARLEGLFSAQRRFVADVSHELRTPLAAMQGNLEVLDRGAARDPVLLAESLADMRREVARLIRMANDLLLLAQSEAGVQIRREPVELDTLLLEIHRELRPLAEGVDLRIGEEDQIVALGDRDRIKQALLNLGVNALQHTPPGGTVTLSLARQDGCAAVSVSDTGAGISAEDLPQIFDRFYRADRSRSRNQGGAGLGLAIVRWIAEAHGGRVDVISAPGRGSTFTLILPLDERAAPGLLQFGHSRPIEKATA